MTKLSSNPITIDNNETQKPFIVQKLTKDEQELHDLVTEFIRDAISNHEVILYSFIKERQIIEENAIGKPSQVIFQMIGAITNHTFNDLYLAIQNQENAPFVDRISSISKYTSYAEHILLKKLLQLIIDIHTDVDRKTLVCDADLSVYIKTVQNQINLIMMNRDILAYLQTESDEENQSEFIPVPKNHKPFSVSIEAWKEKPSSD